MEDFGSIVWVLVVAGILASNLFSKSRKAREKESPHTGEAWPSMEEAPRQKGIQDTIGTPRPEMQESTPPVSRQPAGWPEIPGFPGIPAASGRRKTTTPATQPRKEASGTDFQHASTPDDPTYRRAEQCETEAEKAQTAKTAKTAKTAATVTASPTEHPEEGIPGGKFDLRQAVIYAEILKPKFEE